MHVLLVASEFHPYSKTGGLADAAGALARWLARAGVQVSVVTPFYRMVQRKAPTLQRPGWRFAIPLEDSLVEGEFHVAHTEPNLRIWFVEQPEFFDRAELYNEGIQDYPDNAERFVFFSKAAVLLARYLPDPPQIVHCHDWQTGLVPLFIQYQRTTTVWKNPPRTLFTIHNLAYQGWFPPSVWGLTNLPDSWFHLESASHFGRFNFLKAGLCLADFLSTVSRTYADEITTPEFGCGLDGLLGRRRSDLVGILNGVDYGEWNTSNNPALAYSFGPDALDGKTEIKKALQSELGLPVLPECPLFSNISRLTWQKGCDFLYEALEALLPDNSFQFVGLGNGDPDLETALSELASRHPEKVAAHVGFNAALAQRLEAGSDFFIMPSRFEPCGLNQMYSLRYGAIPLVRATGGLEDSVVDPRDDANTATGIKFHEPTAAALAHAVRKALALYENPEAYRFIQRNGMQADFSWERRVREYIRLYENLVVV